MEAEGHRPLRVEGTPYALLRHLTLPVVAVTSSLEGRGNGMIANGAQRASLIPTMPRISLYINRTNLTHDNVYRTGALAVHLLRRDQLELVYRLGFRSGRDHDKLADIDTRPATTGVPLLADCLAAFDCRVVNAMHAGAATFFLADVVEVREGTAGDVMTSEWFRENLPAERLRQYETLLVHAQEKLQTMDLSVDRSPWPGPSASV
jgi:flavin reductase (DIM6/NTAB) family NADH-FMN oxidoreductase RutF